MTDEHLFYITIYLSIIYIKIFTKLKVKNTLFNSNQPVLSLLAQKSSIKPIS